MKSRADFIKCMVNSEATRRINNRHKRAHRVVNGDYDTFLKVRNETKLEVYDEYLRKCQDNYQRKLMEEQRMWKRIENGSR